MILTLENTSPITAVVTLIVVALATIILVVRLLGKSCLSPGPWGLPLLGFYPFLKKDVHVHLAELANRYGDTYLLSICGKLYLHIGSHKAMREAFIKNAACFKGRTEEVNVLNEVFKEGLTFIDGEPWRVWRKFVVQSMRELGLGPKEQLQGSVLNSLKSTIHALKESKGQSINISEILTFQCTDIVRRLILGENVSKDTAMKLNDIFVRACVSVGEKEMLLCGSVAKHLFLRWSKNYKATVIAREKMESLLHNIVNNHRHNVAFEQPVDLVGFYLKEKKNREEKNDPRAKYFNDETFVGTMIQLYGDSGHSIGAFIVCFLKELATKPDVQDAIYEEIVREIGTERLPTYEDRNDMPYTNSVLKEIERTSVFFPSLITLVSKCDVTISDVFVPKDTISFINFHAIHNNPDVYKNPEQFDPKRFMPNNEDPVPENPVSFGMGKRACAGEQLVRFEIFMFVIAILQNFALKIENTKTTEDGDKVTDFLKIMDCRLSAIPRKDHSIVI